MASLLTQERQNCAKLRSEMASSEEAFSLFYKTLLSVNDAVDQHFASNNWPLPKESLFERVQTGHWLKTWFGSDSDAKTELASQVKEQLLQIVNKMTSTQGSAGSSQQLKDSQA
mmetsp:Transcript_27313/g.41532  ORF Transcript_27313/g.41532 Transcript_27313/m.41532 type:complete len:114 (+) Transcript_27313:132-473(+)